MTELYERKFSEDAELQITLTDKKSTYCWSPEIFGHRGWNLKVADVAGFDQCMLRSGMEFSLCVNGAHYIFCSDKKEMIIPSVLCKTLVDNSVKI